MATVLGSMAPQAGTAVAAVAPAWDDCAVALRLVPEGAANEGTWPVDSSRNEPREPSLSLVPSPSQADAAYVSRLLAKEPRAWRDFVERYEQPLRRAIMRTARRFRSCLCAADTDEVYASLLASLMERDMHKLRVFDASRGRCFASWLTLLAVNETYNHMRQLTRRPQTNSLDPATCSFEDSSDDAFTALALKQRASFVKGLFGDLSEKDRRLIQLLSEEETPDRIATAMGISVKTVYTKKHKVQFRLQAYLSKTGLASAVLG